MRSGKAVDAVDDAGATTSQRQRGQAAKERGTGAVHVQYVYSGEQAAQSPDGRQGKAAGNVYGVERNVEIRATHIAAVLRHPDLHR